MSQKTTEQKFQSCGVRASYQRIKIFEFLEHYGKNTHQKDIFEALKKQLSTLSMTTVYSTLKAFRKSGLLELIPDFEQQASSGSAAINVRRELGEFASDCEKELKLNDHKKHWSQADYTYLMNQLSNKEFELRHAKNGTDAMEQCKHISNYAMMLYDNIKNKRDGLTW